LGGDGITRLLDQAREDNELYILARDVLKNAGFTVQPAGPIGFLCTSDQPTWKNLSPVYVRLVIGKEFGLEIFVNILEEARTRLLESNKSTTVFIVIDREPQASDLHQIFAIQAKEGIQIVLFPESILRQARLAGQDAQVINEQVNLYLGQTDLYDVRSAVSDILSFFGRNTMLNDIERHLQSGHSVMMFGIRKGGKSSVLARLRETSSWPVAMLDLEGYKGNLSSVFPDAMRAWIASISVLYPKLKMLDFPFGDGLSTSEITTVLRQNVELLLNTLAALPEKPGLLLFLDEMDEIVKYHDFLAIASVLRSIAEDVRWKGRFALLLAGLEPTINRLDHFGKSRNPFFSFFVEYPLSPISTPDIERMVISIGGQMGIHYREDALKELADIGGGHPFLTRQLCSYAIRDLEEPYIVNDIRVNQAIREYIGFAHNYMAESLWAIDSGGPEEIDAILLQALSSTEPQEESFLVSSDLSSKTRRKYRLAIQHLQDQSLITRTTEGWKVTIPIFREWIRREILNIFEEGEQ
jgi:hypothetical protein